MAGITSLDGDWINVSSARHMRGTEVLSRSYTTSCKQMAEEHMQRTFRIEFTSINCNSCSGGMTSAQNKYPARVL